MYAAYRAWAAIVARPEFALRLRLAPGDCLIFDNTRILHARTAFATSSPAASSPAAFPPSASGASSGSAVPPASTASSGSAASPGSGERHLQGCYADIDGLLSTLAVLRRTQPSTTIG